MECATLKKNHPTWSKTKILWEASKTYIHTSLDAFGLIPVYGEVADLTNGVLYTIEGDGLNATLSYASAVPVVGWVSATTKAGLKVVNVASDVASKVKLVWTVEGNLIKFGQRGQLRRVLGLAVGDLRQAHHIIPWAKSTSPVIQKAAKSGNAFHLNEALNGIPLDNAIHSGSHARYDAIIQSYLNQVPANATPDQAYSAVITIINKVKTAIANNPGVHINQLNF